MSDEEKDSLPSQDDLSFEDLGHEKLGSAQELRARIRLLEKANLALRQELHKVRRSPSRGADEQTTKETDKDQTIPKSSDFISSMSPTSMQPSGVISQTQDQAFRKLSGNAGNTALDYRPSMQYMSNQYQKDTSKHDTASNATVQELVAATKDIQERLRKLEYDEQNAPLKNRVAVCEKKMDTMISRKHTFETKVQEVVSVLTAQNKSREGTFQAFILSKAAIKKLNVDIRLDQFKEFFCPSPYFSQETCEYTVPETGLYAFYVRWRQSGRGQFRVTIHWGDVKVSRLGQTSPENDVLCPTIRRYVEEGVKVWLTITMMSGTPTLESCDFGASLVSVNQVVNIPS